MTIKRIVFNKISDALIAFLGLNRPTRWSRAFSSRVNCTKRVTVNGTNIDFDANDELHLMRALWIDTKEPETLSWIDTFSQGDLFYDVGANVGVFSLYAALHRGCQVYAFEPEAKNYACLNKNIYLNKLGRQVRALNIALHDLTTIQFLNLHDLESGSALHSIGEPIDWRGRRFEPKFEQAVLAFGLDDFIDRFGVPVPNHIKLDVDGNENKIIRGGKRTFSNPAMKSLLIEINENDRALHELIESCGLRLEHKTLASSPDSYRDTFNAVFVRK